MTEYIGLIIPLVAALVGSQELVKWIRHRVEEERKNKFTPTTGIKYNDKQYDIMGSILAETNFGHAMIMRASNGGGKLSPGEPIYINCTAEIFHAPFHSEKQNYIDYAAPGEYISSINKMISSESGCFDIDPNEVGGRAKEIFSYKGVKFSRMVYLAQHAEEVSGRVSHKIYFLVLNSAYSKGESGESPPIVSAVSDQYLSMRVSELRNLFRKMYAS